MNMSAGLKAFLALLFAVGAGAVIIVPKLLEKEAASVASQVADVETEAVAEVDVVSPDSSLEQTDAPDTASQPASDGDSAGENVEVASLGETFVQPSFDILRVEPDGSTVIAGKAEPNTTLDIMNGETVIASAAVGPSGDFAAILDDPLAAGDYQLTLRTMGESGAVRVSEEVATVSIPESPDGELLAMVSKPGKASRIIAQPAAPAPQADVAEADEGDAGAGVASASDAEAASEPEIETAAAPAGDQGIAENTSGEAVSQSVPEAGVETPPLPEMSSLLTTSAPQIESGNTGIAVPEVESSSDVASGPPDETAGDDGDQTVAEQTEVAAVSSDVADAVASEPTVDVSVRVDAIEIEGQQIFIAGSATPGYRVTVSADGVEIGTEKSDSGGRFILEADADLSVGDHIISADLIDPASGEILLRATVPFNRPEGETLAAVSPVTPEPVATPEPETAPEVAATPEAETAPEVAATPEAETAPEAAVTPEPETAPAAVAAPEPETATEMAATPEAEKTPEAGEMRSAEGLVLPDVASISKLREDAFEALSALEKMVSADVAPGPAEIASARDTALAKLKAVSTADLAAESDAEALAIAESIRAQAQAALAVLDPGGAAQDAGGDPDILTGDMADMREMLGQARAALTTPAELAVAAAEETATDGSASEPRTIQQAPLASAPGAVIIRRGDTLWQIPRPPRAKRFRYTTIYLANRSQIQNPDRIQPGQVFSVPDTPLEDAEELHRKRLQGDSLR